ncbi:DM13 domain-containing protein [Humibacillus xanthopallidus]|uniref:Electron transfer DM13 n=1 Tax=Humibacillus xanthopallidus TaxID=412689 RepID=A0A543HTQ4_9MICO|nr:DM13 domain-containing protein [Humibacillus xanthopallidus]TQM61672.1 electron transfer DM13 [Humibacillus xanthopallidus]
MTHDTSPAPEGPAPGDPPPHDPTPSAPGRRTGRRRILIAVSAVVAALLVGGLVLFQPWRLVTRSTVDEALPVAATTPADADPSGGLTPTPAGPSPTEPTGTTSTTAPNASPPSARPALDVLSEGRFIDAEHATSGTARIVQLADGSRYLRLEGFSTSDGPDVDVWLTDQPAGGDWHRYDDRFHVSLGDLKGTDGNQNYAIPGDVDLSRLRSVAIWCDRFDVAFGTAPIRIA